MLPRPFLSTGTLRIRRAGQPRNLDPTGNYICFGQLFRSSFDKIYRTNRIFTSGQFVRVKSGCQRLPSDIYFTVMNSKERMRRTMAGEKPDRVPVMCQLGLGHIYKHAGLSPVDYWYTSAGMAEGYIRMAERYGFDGILLSKTGLNPETARSVKSVTAGDSGHLITWNNGNRTFCPPDEYPRSLNPAPPKTAPTLDQIDPARLPIIESEQALPPFYFDIMDYVLQRKGESLSIHGEVGTVFERFLLMFGSFENGLMALMDDPARCTAIMARMNRAVIVQALAQCKYGVDAMKLSSPIAGAGFISRNMYAEFVLPYEKEVIAAVHREHGLPCYIHTCGAIGDRLDLMVQTGTDGLECLDPPPLGTVDLEEAVAQIGSRVFIKGNLDSVNELYRHSVDEVREIAHKRIDIGRRARGYILSSACSVAPVVPPENVACLRDAVERYGQY